MTHDDPTPKSGDSGQETRQVHIGKLVLFCLAVLLVYVLVRRLLA